MVEGSFLNDCSHNRLDSALGIKIELSPDLRMTMLPTHEDHITVVVLDQRYLALAQGV